MPRNTTPEIVDEELIEKESTQEEILMNESDILKGLLEAGKFKDDESNYCPIQIRRSGKLLFSFRIRPLSEDEIQTCYKNATRYSKPKQYGAPKKAIETDRTKLRANLIYTATVDEDREKVWNNKRALDAFNVLSGVDLIDMVLLAGEKDLICDNIDEISGFNSDLEEQAKKLILAGGLTAALSYIFLHTGKTPSEMLAMAAGERAICIAGARLAMQAQQKVSSAKRL